jgi:hypothetical protein
MRTLLLRLGLVCLAVASGLVTWLSFRSGSPPEPARAVPRVAPGAVRLVTTYLRALQSGHRARACRLLELPSVCSVATAPRVARFSVDPAELTVDGFDVHATVDGQDALFQLRMSGRTYRIVDVLTDPTSPGVAAIGIAS